MALSTAILVGSAIAGGASLIGSTINAMSTASTNRRQEDLMREQMAYQTSEREAAQEYNNPVNQRKRFEAAGINPYFALSNMDAGNTTAMSSPASPQLSAPQYGDIFKALGDSTQNGLDTYQKFQNAESFQLGIERDRVDTRFKLTEKLLELNKQRLEIQGLNISNEAKQQQMDFITKQMTRLQQDIDATNADWNESRKTAVANRKIAEADADFKDLQNEYQKWFNDFAKQRGEKELQVMQSTIAANMSQALLNGKLSEKAIADKVLSECQSKGVQIDNFQKNKINWLIREQVRLGNEYQRYSNENFWKTKFLDIFGSGAVTAGAAYVGAKGAKGGKPAKISGFK